MRVASAADVASWLAAQGCRCGARAFAADPVLVERNGTVGLRVGGCAKCGEPAYFDAELPEPIERAVSGKHVLDPSAITLLAPFVANGFPDYAGPGPDAIDMSGIVMPRRWRIIEWLRGSFGYGQARCLRDDGVRALATFTIASRTPLDRIVSSLALNTRGVVPILDAQVMGRYAVLFEAEPPGVPLSTSMFPLTLDLALAVFGKLLEITGDAAAQGEVLYSLRPELVYLDRALVVAAVPRGERFAMTAPESRDLNPQYPFNALYCGPETVQSEKKTPAYDVFSCCAMLLFLVTRRAPFAGPNIMYQIAAMLQGPPPLPAALDPRTAELVRRGLSPDPAQRPTARELAAAVVVS
jgi:hypothetical protein